MRLLSMACLALAVLSAGRTRAMEPIVKVLRTADFEGANLLAGPGFEQVHEGAATGWQPYQEGYDVAPGGGRDGGGAVHCLNPTAAGRRGARQVIELNQQAPGALLVRGWSRAREVEGTKGSNYSIYVDLTYQDGTSLWAQTADFNIATHDWEFQEVIICPAKPLKSAAVYALFRGMSGEVWFDDVEAYDLAAAAGAVLDMASVLVPQPGPIADVRRAEDRIVTGTGDGLVLTYDWRTGRVASLQTDGVELASRGASSGFLVRDVAAESDFFGFEGGKCPPLELELEAAFEGDDECIRVSGILRDRTGQDRAVTLMFAVPVDGAGWTWHDDVSSAVKIGPHQEYFNVRNIGTGANGNMSAYPCGCMDGPDGGLALALDMGMPGQYRIGYSSAVRTFFIAYDFGLVADTANFPSGAPFRFVIYRTDPAWGFRSALERLYDIFPDYFACRSRKQGIWMPFTDVSTVKGWQDFGFRYHEGNNNVPFDDEADILSFRYTEPSTWWFPIDPEVPRTRENVVRLLRETAESDNAWRRRNAQAALVSGSHDAEGRIQYLVRDAPWTNGVVFSLNPNPFIPGESEARMNWNEEVKQRLYGPEAAGGQDGEYLDSLEAYVTAGENFRREHFSYVTVPLTFAHESGRPVIYKALSIYEFTRWIAEDVHGMGKLMFANSVPSRFSFLCPWLDIMGCEMDWLDAGGGWQPPSHQVMNLKRAMCHHKPYLILMNTRFGDLTPDLVEKYFQRCLFYGIWPSMFSHNASDDPYWKNSQWYNRDRHLFKRYIPLVRLAAEAGWEPITHAHTESGGLYVERFGPSGEGVVYFTLLNDTEESQDATLSVDAALLKLDAPPTLTDLVTGDSLAVRSQDGRLHVSCPLGPEQVRLIALQVRE